VKTSNVSSAAIFRLSELHHPTFLMDEAQDQLKNEDFCLVIKSGHTSGDVAIRCDPNTNEPLTFDVFCPKVLAGIGRANGQIMSRSVLIEMGRRDGQTDRGTKQDDPIFIAIRRKLARWASDCGNLARFHIPSQAGLKLRNRDNWEVFYRVACAVSQKTAERLLAFIDEFIDEEQDFATYLLDSLRTLYHEHGQLTEDGFMGSEAIIEELNKDKEAPWYAKNDRGLTVEALGRHLKRYKVKPDRVWQPDIEKKLRGYRHVDDRPHHNDLQRIFKQYLPPLKQE
jgi:putative DNA primase/helicase